MTIEIEIHEENQALIMMFCIELEKLFKKHNYEVLYSGDKYIDIIKIGDEKIYNVLTYNGELR